MKSLYRSIFTILSMAGIVIFTSHDSLTKGNGAPPNNTGSPGDGKSCARIGCHNTTANTGPGSVNIDHTDIPAAGYAPGQKYSITVNVVDGDRFTFGFEFTAENSATNKMGTLIGNTAIQVDNVNGSATHKIANGTGVFTFDWQAPSSTDDITFYVAGNAANGDGNSTGDRIYTGSSTIKRDLTATGIADAQDNEKIKVKFSSSDNILRVESEEATILQLFSLSGRMIDAFNIQRGNSTLNLSHISSGLYILSSPELQFSQRIIVR